MDLRHEISRELEMVDAPDLWEQIQALAQDEGFAAGRVGLDSRGRAHRSLGLVAAAALTIVVGLVGAVVLQDDDQTVDTTPATQGDDPTVTEPVAGSAPPTTQTDLADIVVGDRFRVADVVVEIRCTAAKSTPDSTMRDLVLGGVVTENPAGRFSLDGVNVGVGRLLALIIRDGPDDLGRRVTLYPAKEWYNAAPISGCDELVESVPTWVDGGFFEGGIPGGYEILPPG